MGGIFLGDGVHVQLRTEGALQIRLNKGVHICLLPAADNEQMKEQGNGQNDQGQKAVLEDKDQGGNKEQQKKEHLHAVSAVHLLKVKNGVFHRRYPFLNQYKIRICNWLSWTLYHKTLLLETGQMTKVVMHYQINIKNL